MAQDPNDSRLNMVVYSENLMAPFKKNFPNTHQLMEYNLMGTLKLLKALDVLETKKIKETTAADHDGNHAQRTWAEYKTVIETNLSKINGLSDWRMAKARPIISNVIHNQYYKKYPCWPSVGKIQSGYVYITCSNTHEACKGDQKFQVTWSCEGGVNVKDTRPSIDVFQCEINGQPTFKILYFDLIQLKSIESDFGIKMLKVKAKVDKLNNKDANAEKLRSKLDALLL